MRVLPLVLLLLLAGTVNAGQYYYGMRKDCYVFVTASAQTLGDIIQQEGDGEKPDPKVCASSQVLLASDKQSVLFAVAIEGPKRLRIYGANIPTDQHELLAGDGILINFAEESEVLDLTYILGSMCNFDSDFFDAVVEESVLYITVKCQKADSASGETEMWLLRGQLVVSEKTIFFPPTFMLHVGELSPTLQSFKFTMIPYAPLSWEEGGSSYLAWYGPAAGQNSLAVVMMKLYKLSSYDNVLYMRSMPPNPAYLRFCDRQFLVLRDSSNGWHYYESKDLVHVDRNAFDYLTAQVTTLGVPTGAGEMVHSLCIGVRSGESDLEPWISRTDTNPLIKTSVDSLSTCDHDKIERELEECRTAVKEHQTTLIILYCMTGFEFFIIAVTIGLFVFCIFKQRKRRKAHRDKKRQRRHKKKSGTSSKKDESSAPKSSKTDDSKSKAAKSPKSK